MGERVRGIYGLAAALVAKRVGLVVGTVPTPNTALCHMVGTLSAVSIRGSTRISVGKSRIRPSVIH